MNRAKTSTPRRRQIPSVDRVVRELAATDVPRPVLVAVARRELARLRSDLAETGDVPADAVARVRAAVDNLRLSRIRPVINATGIVVHTNLGRSPLGKRVTAAVAEAAAHYTNLEYDLARGERGRRGGYVEHSLAVLCGAEAATVVNNCAAALVLVLRHFAATPPRNEVVISRGQLVQIGGGFRIPEILEASGARLREVGTTNKTIADDYRRAVGPATALVLKVHHSNFYMDGFVETPSTPELAAIARQAGVPLVEDLGSGSTFDTALLGGGEHEPTPRQALAAGADLVCFSGDKLLGGPQAGVIAGSAAHVSALRKDPFFRALRCDRLILSALEATVDLLLADRTAEIPVRAMLQEDVAALRGRAVRVVAASAGLPVRAKVGEAMARVGGGALPRTMLPSVTVDLEGSGERPAVALQERLRLGTPAVIGYVEADVLRLDLRTVFPAQDEQLVAAIRAAAVAPA